MCVSAFKRFLREEDAASAVQFALIAMPFFFLVFGLLEAAILLFMNVMLDYATQETSRLVRTGQLPQEITMAEFANTVCDQSVALPACAARLEVDVQVISDFESGDIDSPFDPTGAFDPTAFDVDVGGSRDIVVVRTFYEWPVTTPFLRRFLSNMPGGQSRLLVASEAMQNEPF